MQAPISAVANCSIISAALCARLWGAKRVPLPLTPLQNCFGSSLQVVASVSVPLVFHMHELPPRFAEFSLFVAEGELPLDLHLVFALKDVLKQEGLGVKLTSLPCPLCLPSLRIITHSNPFADSSDEDYFEDPRDVPPDLKNRRKSFRLLWAARSSDQPGNVTEPEEHVRILSSAPVVRMRREVFGRRPRVAIHEDE